MGPENYFRGQLSSAQTKIWESGSRGTRSRGGGGGGGGGAVAKVVVVASENYFQGQAPQPRKSFGG